MLAGRVVAEVAAVGLDQRLMGCERWVKIGEIGGKLGAIDPARRDVGDGLRFRDDPHSGTPRGAGPIAVEMKF